MALVGLFVRPHLTNLNRLVAKEIEQSDLLNVEEALVPERRYRIGQLIRLCPTMTSSTMRCASRPIRS